MNDIDYYPLVAHRVVGESDVLRGPDDCLWLRLANIISLTHAPFCTAPMTIPFAYLYRYLNLFLCI